MRPLVTRIIEAVPGPAAAPGLAGPEGQRLLSGPVSGIAGALPSPGVAAGIPATATAAGGIEAVDQMIDISQVEGRVRASSIKKIGEIVEKHPEEAVAIVRSWMYQNA